VRRWLGIAAGLIAAASLLPAPAADGLKLFEPGQSRKVFDVEGKLHRLGDDLSVKATVLVFLSPECPIACKYVPDLKHLADARREQGIALYGVVSDPNLSRTKAATFVQDFQITFPLLFDSSLDLARQLAPTHTPEAFVFSSSGEIVYRGRIDDRFAELGKERPQASHHDLEDCLADILAQRAPEVAYRQPVGCRFEALRGPGSVQGITFCRDIAPIVWNNCASCHRSGEVAPFTLTCYEDVRKRAEQIADVVTSGYMPPWHAQPGFGRFLDERCLSAAEIKRIVDWAQSGAPEGDLADLPPLPEFTEGWQLGEPDLVVQFPEPFEIPADGGNIIRYFALPLPREAQGRYVSAFEFRPGNRRVVHHSIAFLDATGIGKAKDDADPKPGYDGFGGPGFPPIGYLGAWVPGAIPRRLAEGLGMPIPAGSMAVVMMHYSASGKDETDQSMLGIHFCKEPKVRPVTSVPVTNTDLEIPPGESHYRVATSFTLPMNATALSVTPHMHYLGREMRVVARLPDQSEPVPLIWIKDWDFNWQGEYQLHDPIRLPKGTVIEVEGFYDNTTGNPRNPFPVPKLVKYGQDTTDEMCLCGVQIALDDVKDFAPYAAHLMRRFIRVKDGRLVIVPLE
jgi:peroxiredoxin